MSDRRSFLKNLLTGMGVLVVAPKADKHFSAEADPDGTMYAFTDKQLSFEKDGDGWIDVLHGADLAIRSGSPKSPAVIVMSDAWDKKVYMWFDGSGKLKTSRRSPRVWERTRD